MARKIEELMEAVQMLEVLNREKDEFSLDTSMNISIQMGVKMKSSTTPDVVRSLMEYQ